MLNEGKGFGTHSRPMGATSHSSINIRYTGMVSVPPPPGTSWEYIQKAHFGILSLLVISRDSGGGGGPTPSCHSSN